MNFSRMIKKLGLLPAYAVAIRKRGTNEPFQVKYPTNLEWYADPFVCNDKGKEYVFVELMNSYHLDGEIAVASVENGRIGKFKVVIHEAFHMSFPNVFQWQGTWYMLPETNMSNEVRLYRAEQFPYHWHLDKILLKDIKLVDHALYPIEDGFLVISYDITDSHDMHNRIYHLNMNFKTMEEIFPQGKWCKERPGGTFYQKDRQWYHVIQDCEKAYGDFLHVYKTTKFTENELQEEKVGEIHPSNVEWMPKKAEMQHLHTYNCDEQYEVIDLQYMKTYPDKFFIHQSHEILKRIKGRKSKK